jgi:MATE family multidrug resistance protein
MQAPTPPPPTSLPWKDRPLAELRRISWPIAVSMLSFSVMTLVDTVLVGHLGRAQLAGVGLAGVASFLLLSFSIGTFRAANTLVSQAVGANRSDEGQAIMGAVLVAAIGTGFVTLGAGQIVAELLRHFTATPASGDAARTYMQLRSLGAPLALVFSALREVCYGRGESHAPMRASLIANLVNITLAYLFVFVLGRGVAGAAIASVIAQGTELGFLAFTQRARGFGLRAWRGRHLLEIGRIGIPLGLQFTLEFGSFALLSFLISHLSEVEMAAHQIALQIIHFSFLPAFAVGEGAAVLAGQAVGADRDDLVVRIARLATKATTVYTGACTLLLIFGARILTVGFTHDEVVVRSTVALLHVAAAFLIIDGSNSVARGALRGAGDVRYAAVVGVVTSWVCTPPLCWLLGYRLGLGARGGWLGLCLEMFVCAALMWWRLQNRGWAAAAAMARARLAAPSDGTIA